MKCRMENTSEKEILHEEIAEKVESKEIDKNVQREDIHDFEYIITDTEDEALILECNLIKKYKPKFNVLLKDDKTYPYIKVGEKNGKPIIQLTRNLVKDGSKYYGPYPSVWSAKEMIKYIKDIYMSILNRPFLDETLKNEEKEKIYKEIKRVLSRKY